MQHAAFAQQEEVLRNMCATFLSVSDDNLVQPYAPQPERILVHVMPRQQDGDFATELALVVSEYFQSLAATQPGTVQLFCEHPCVYVLAVGQIDMYRLYCSC